MKDDREDILSALGGEIDDADGAALPTSPPPAAVTHDGTAETAAAFAAAAAANQCQVARVESLAQLPAVTATFLRAQLSELSEQSLDSPAPIPILCEEEFLPLPWQAAGIHAAHRAPEKSDLCGVTGVTAAAADTGAMLVADDVPHRLTLSLLPPYHIAVVAQTATCSDLAALWRRLPQPLPRGNVLIGGPSRTADIEQTLTLGVHGPIGVLVVLVERWEAPPPPVQY